MAQYTLTGGTLPVGNCFWNRVKVRLVSTHIVTNDGNGLFEPLNYSAMSEKVPYKPTSNWIVMETQRLFLMGCLVISQQLKQLEVIWRAGLDQKWIPSLPASGICNSVRFVLFGVVRPIKWAPRSFQSRLGPDRKG